MISTTEKKTAFVFATLCSICLVFIGCSEREPGPDKVNSAGSTATGSTATDSAATGSASAGSASPGSALSAVSSKTLFLEANGRKLAYRKIGTGAPLLLCNRFRGILDNWDPMFLDELAKNYSVITFDYSGIGLSSLPAGRDSLQELKDVSDLVSGLSLGTISLIGWSHGGKVAQVYAANNPSQVSNLILLGSGPIGKSRFAPEKIFFKHALKPVNDREDEVILFFEPRYADSREAAKQYRERVKERKSDTSHYVTPEKFAKYFASVEGYNSNEAAKENLFTGKIPMLALSGEHDIVFPIESWYEQTGKNPNLQIIMLPRAGHGPQSQYPVLTAQYIRSSFHMRTSNKC